MRVEKHHTCEKGYIWSPATCSCNNGKYSVSIIDDSVISLMTRWFSDYSDSVMKLLKKKQKQFQ